MTFFPNLRFPGFDKEWEEKKLGEIMKNISSGKSKSITSQGKYPFFGSTGIISYSNKSDYSGDKILIARVGANAGFIYKVEGSYAVSDNALILDVKNEKSLDFIFYYLLKYNLNKLIFGSGQPLITGGQLKSIEIKLPLIEEQKKISSFIFLIDKRIQTQKKIIEDLQITKKEISLKLFKDGFNSPKSKKENFQKLGDITYVVNKKNKENLKLPVYSINNKKGFISQSEQFDGIDSDERGYDISLYKIIEKETFAYNPARINVGSIGYSGNLENIIISSLYVCFKTTDTVDDGFLFQYLRTDIFRKEVLRNVEGGVRDYLFYESFSRIKINLPDIKEQKKIAEFLYKLDEKINLENDLLIQYENQKKYLLQNLFI
ncbi:restriction endonuclease subunit S [Elizabethkingia anophelis]|nr:restriction endonuclease subunit S [Elizabethkingia anophelis]MCT3813447.1 restriction endonuclease subunit S [Elizabethkingia anophelis]MCT3820542.1 restriction endonuclease subunit S [Elizabethkingia anophelis]MDV3768527.1 hypothetical protein [Elizabethkingia anophelis]MDV4036138.1 hypothetical protein [Elizabethkingia anophelis]